MPARLLVVAWMAKNLAILQGRLTAEPVRNVVVKVKLDAEQCAAGFVLALAGSSTQSFTFDLPRELAPHETNSNSRK